MESTAPATYEIARLPDDLLAASLARTGPQDACRAALVSPAFLAAADADAVWSSLLPRDLPALTDEELPADPRYTKKQLFMRLYVRDHAKVTNRNDCARMKVNAVLATDSPVDEQQLGVLSPWISCSVDDGDDGVEAYLQTYSSADEDDSADDANEYI